MTDQVSSEFSSFLRLLMHENPNRYLDDAKTLIKMVKEASVDGLDFAKRQKCIDALTDHCRELVRRLDNDHLLHHRHSIPMAVREFGLSTLDRTVKMILLGSFELAVRRFERPNAERGSWPSAPA